MLICCAGSGFGPGRRASPGHAGGLQHQHVSAPVSLRLRFRHSSYTSHRATLPRSLLLGNGTLPWENGGSHHPIAQELGYSACSILKSASKLFLSNLLTVRSLPG
eukprot:scaffold289336_cov17-Prasinocladus_malaysianus.AAC.1